MLAPILASGSYNVSATNKGSEELSGGFKVEVSKGNDYGLYIVTLKGLPSKEIKGIFTESGIEILHEYKLISGLLVKGSLQTLIQIARRSGIIKGIYENKRFQLLSGSSSDGISVATLTSAKKIGANILWDLGINGTGVKVAVIDTGIDKNHPDLKFPNGTEKVIYAKSFVSPTYGYNVTEGPSDVEGHGTAVAGVIAGTGAQDSERGKGVAPGALLMNAKVFPRGQSATLAAIIAAIEWAVYGPDGQLNTGDEADVINMSLGGGQSYIDPLYEAVKRAFELGVTVVIAAGNEGEGGLSSMSSGSPGNSEYAITVGATDPNGASLKDYSSFGPTIRLTVKPDVVAPSGVDTIFPTSMGSYASDMEGTSFSCPHVAGAAALLVQYLKQKQAARAVWPSAIKVALMETAVPVSGYDTMAIGAGFVRVDLAYEYLENAEWSNNVPKIWTWLPKKLPIGYTITKKYFPWGSKIFRGQNVLFNLTIITPMETDLNFELDDVLGDIFEVNSILHVTSVTGVYLWEFNATVRNDAELGSFKGNITIEATGLGKMGILELSGVVAEAELWMLFDLSHTSWTIDMRYGQYMEFALFAESNNIAIETLFFGHKITNIDLSKYDILFVPDAASYYYTYDPSGNVTGIMCTSFTDKDIELIIEFVRNGGILLLSAMDPEDNDFDNLNELTREFGVEFKGPRFTEDVTTMDLDTGNIIANNTPKLPFYGSSLKVVDNNKVMVIGTETSSRKVVMTGTIMSNGEKAGLALITSTNFMFDNWAFNGEYTGVSSIYVTTFFSNIFRFAKEFRNNMYIDIPKYVNKSEYTAHIKLLEGLQISSIKLVTETAEQDLTPNQISDTDYTVTLSLTTEGYQFVTLTFSGLATGKIVSTFIVDTTAPSISDVSWEPSSPMIGDNITIKASVSDNLGIEKVVLSYKMEDEWVNVTMTFINNTYQYTIYNVTVSSLQFRIIAMDIAGNVAESNVYTIELAQPQAPLPVTTILLGAIVAVVIIIAAIFFLKKRKQ